MSVYMCVGVSGLFYVPSYHYPAVFSHLTSLSSSPPPPSHINHPQASQETLWGSFDWSDIAASGFLEWRKTSDLLHKSQKRVYCAAKGSLFQLLDMLFAAEGSSLASFIVVSMYDVDDYFPLLYI